MQERIAMLNMVAELRGRLDELERMIQTAPNHSILSPVSYDEDGVVDLTPVDYSRYRATGLPEPRIANRYEPLPLFHQFGAPDTGTVVEVSGFALSDLHRTGPEPAFGLRLVPKAEAAQPWFTYEFLMPVENPTAYVWLEWVLKLAFDHPLPSFAQFILDGDGFAERIDVGILQISDFPAFRHVRLDRAAILNAAAGRPVRRIRLTFSTGGALLPLTVYGLSIFGRRGD